MSGEILILILFVFVNLVPVIFILGQIIENVAMATPEC